MEINQGISLSAFFGTDHPYHIPKYQRPYCWTTEIEDLWFDIVALVRNNEQNKERKHFFGQIVIHSDDTEDGTKYYIVDGQQRTVTSIIFLAVLRDVAKTFEINDDTGKISEAAKNIGTYISYTLLSTYSINSDELVYKFVFENADDRMFFRENIQTNSPNNIKDLRAIPQKPKNSHECIENAYWYLYTSLNDIIDNEGGNTSEAFIVFKKFYTAFLNGFIIINLETKDLSDAYDIFESLNARGKDLDTSDLLKNYMFKTVGKKEEETMSKLWDKMSTNLNGKAISSYIRCYWNSLYPFSRERELYRNIRREIGKDANKCSAFIKGLADESNLYAELLSPKSSSQYFNTKDKYDIHSSIIGLKKMKSILYFPLILALIRKNYESEYIRKVMQVIETIIFRNIVVSGEKSNFLETKFAALANIISHSNNKVPIKDVIGELVEKTKNDDSFKADLSAYNTDKKEMIRYIFSKINTFELRKESHEINLCDNNQELQIEHIMPEKPSNEWWEMISQEDHDKYLWNLGNLSLLDFVLNDKASNKPFEEKKKYYERSQLWSNKMLCDENTYPVWNIDMIKKRKDVLINEALSVWPRILL